MNLIIRNQYLKLAQLQPFSRAQRSVSKTVTVFTLASVVTGLNYYFQNFICDN